MKSVVDALEQRPNTVFCLFLALHAVVWSALPAVFFPNLPLDLIEALVYGREWQLGYDKLPPLPWWLVEIVYRVFGHDLFYYALSQLIVIAAFVAVWMLGRPLVGAAGALVAILIIDGIHYFNFTSPKFNHNVVQLPFWALAGYAYWAALRHGRMRHWLLLGLAVGIAVWAKYFIVVLAAPFVLFLLFDKDARKSLATPGPWLAFAVAVVVALPHLVWLWQNEFVPFNYAESRAHRFTGAVDYVRRPGEFLLLQFGCLIPALLIASPYLRRDTRDLPSFPVQITAFDRRIVTLLAFGPVVTVTAMSILTGRALIALWGYPLWLFLGLWIVMEARALDRVTLFRIATVWAICAVSYVAVFVAEYSILPRYDQKYRATLFPGDRLGPEISRRFRALTGQPVAYVISNMWNGANASHYAPERPRVLIDGNPRRAPWIDLGDLRARGAVIVWTTGNPRVIPADLQRIGADAEVQEPFQLKPHVGGPTVTVGWAVLRPRPAVAAR